MTKRILIYTPGTGLGHLRRSHNIAREILNREADCSILVIAESQATPFFAPLQGVDYVKLPTIVKRDSFTWEVDTLNLDLERTLRLRTNMIEQAFRHFAPDVIFVDHRPVGLLGELKPLLDDMGVRTERPRLFLGLRDISDHPEANLKRWTSIGEYDYLHYYEKILVYGCRHIYDSESAYHLNGHVQEVTYCNYVAPEVSPEVGSPGRAVKEPFVLVTGGGGEDSFPLIMTFLDALPMVLPDTSLKFLVITGPSIVRPQYEVIAERCKELPVQLCRTCEDASRLIQQAEAVVSLAGYNTMCEILLAKKKALVVPRPTQTAEQRIRSERFAELDLVKMIDPLTITAASMATGLMELLRGDAIPDLTKIPPVDGAQRIASLVLGVPDAATSAGTRSNGQ